MYVIMQQKLKACLELHCNLFYYSYGIADYFTIKIAL